MPDHRTSDAARFLVETVDTRRGEVTILATGALTNLYGAYLLDNDFFKKVKNIIVMGGLTEKLLINGHAVDELNFSCDPEATYHVLRSVAPKTVVTGNLCLQAFFGGPGSEPRPKEWPGGFSLYPFPYGPLDRVYEGSFRD